MQAIYLADTHSRSFLMLPKNEGVDFRASCFCHKVWPLPFHSCFIHLNFRLGAPTMQAESLDHSKSEVVFRVHSIPGIALHLADLCFARCIASQSLHRHLHLPCLISRRCQRITRPSQLGKRRLQWQGGSDSFACRTQTPLLLS